MRNWILGAVAVLALGTVALADNDNDQDFEFRFDFGLLRDRLLEVTSNSLFGVNRGVAMSSLASIDAATAEASPTALITVARGLKARVVTAAASAAANIDQIALFPGDRAPTHLIVCNEGGPADPGVQRIRISDGLVETMITGTSSCDPIRRTPWGTILVGEEAGGGPNGGQVFECLNPLDVTGVTFDRIAGTFSGGSGAANCIARRALGRLSFEGLAIYANGVVYYGDEKRPSNGTPGGAYFKFVPTAPFSGPFPITSLSQSPFASGSVFGLRLGRRSGNTDFGQGTNTGRGTWILLATTPNVDLSGASAMNRITGFYRPEDADIDSAAQAAGNVRFCGNNTGNEGDDRTFGETICITDGTIAQAASTTMLSIPEVQFLVVGTPELAMMDNIGLQPGTGNFVLTEDGDGPDVGRNNDVFSCLDDGADDDLLSDGCLRVATLNDLTAEPTGGIFDASGRNYFLSIQHNVTGHGVVLNITGWKIKK
jgi:secreted PhoX family phosphatase